MTARARNVRGQGETPKLALQPKRASPPAEITHRVLAGAIGIQRVQIAPGAEYEFAWRGPQHYLAFHDLLMRRGQLFVNSAFASRRTDLRGTLSFFPADTRISGWSATTRRTHSFTALYIDPERLPVKWGARLARSAGLSPGYFADPALQATTAKLHDSLRDPAGLDTAYVESLCVTSLLELCRHADRRGQDDVRAQGTLSATVVRRLDEYIDANLHRDLSLTELAGVAGLSSFHFIRVFKRTTGYTPYQYLMRRRIEGARSSLAGGEHAVQAVAAAFGFGSTQRFIRAFRRYVGVTPGEMLPKSTSRT